MALDYNRLASMTQDEAIKYLESIWGTESAPWAGALRPVYETSTTNETGPRLLGYMTPGLQPAAPYGEGVLQGDFVGNDGTLVRVPAEGTGSPEYYGPATVTGTRTSTFDPHYEGGVYGHYEQQFSPLGEYLGTKFVKDERHGGWFSENLDWLGPLIVGGAALGGATLGASGLGGAGAGTAGGAGSAGAFGGISEAALGELGINTALPAGAAGAPYGASPWLAGEAVGSEALLGGISGEAGADLLAGEVLKDTAGLDKLIWQSAAKDAAVQAGLSAELATMAGEVAGGLAGSGLTLDAAIASGLEAATAGAATGAVGGAGTVIGGGGALTAGLPGMLTGTSGASLLSTLGSGARDVWNAGKSAYTAVKPVLDTGKKIVDVMTGTKPDSSSGLLGGLGGIGGILGLALLMAQLRKDRNAPAANATPVIPRLRSRVEQKPFTLDAQGNKQAPLAYFGQPVYYAAGGGIGGLAAGGQASRAVRGPGTGVSDSIPARINGTEPAALADGEFVIDARTVSMIGDGSTEAGTRELEAMVDRVWHADSKARRGEASGADKQLVA